MKDKKPPALYPSPSYFPSGLSAFEQMLEDYQAEKDYQSKEKAKVEAVEKEKVEAAERSQLEAAEKEREIASLRKQLAYESNRVESIAGTLHEARRVGEEQKSKIGRQGAIMTAGFIGMVFLGLFSPVSHRLSPDIGNEHDDSGRIGQVTGFHYQRNSWWGLKKETFDRIRFVPNRGAQYLDNHQIWQDVPPDSWGDHSGSKDDRVMEVDNRGWHEQ